MRLTDEQIGDELRALRTAPEEAFAATLDGRVEAGFPAVKRPHAALTVAPRRIGWKGLGPALAALAAIGLLVVVISNGGGGSTPSPGGGESLSAPSKRAPGAAAQSEAPRSGAGGSAVPNSTLVPAPTPPIAGRPHNGQPQVQERSASIGLSTDAGKLQDAADGVIQVTDRYDGFVYSSTVHAGGSNGHASFSLRIPTVHLQDALADLSTLGHVTSRDEGSTNVTGPYTDAGKAYAEARARVDSLRARLRAASPSEAPAIRRQLAVARDQLAAARAALRGLKQRVALTPVSVEIVAHGDGSWTIGDAANDAGRVLVAIGGALLIALAVLIPLAALVALAWVGTRGLRRRYRESVLDR